MPASHRTSTHATTARRGRRWLLAAGSGAIVIAAVLWRGKMQHPAVTRAEQNAYAPVVVALTFPPSVTTAPRDLRELYEFVARRPDVEHYLPCFCGCWRAGHKSNYDCFVDGVGADGTVRIDEMGFT